MNLGRKIVGHEKMNVTKHETAVVASEHVGDGTIISPFAQVCAGAVLGNNCSVGTHAVLEDGVVIGSRVTVLSGAFVCGGVTIEDDVVIGPNVVFDGDPALHPGSPQGDRPPTLVREGVSIGANACILRGLTIGNGARIGAGTVVTHDVPSHAIVTGNPARIVGYVGVLMVPQDAASPGRPGKALPTFRTKGASLHHLPRIVDLRGALTFGEIERHLPFVPKRFFVVYDVPNVEVRGEHAHKELHQFIVCLKGSCSIMLDDGEYRDEVVLDTPTLGLHMQPLLWGVQYKFSPDAVMLVLASDVYKADDYIRDYRQFRDTIGRP